MPRSALAWRVGDSLPFRPWAQRSVGAAFGGEAMTGGFARTAAPVLALLLALTGCAGEVSGQSTPTQTVTVLPPSAQPTTSDANAEDRKRVSAAFLEAVCPSDYAIGVLDNAAITAGGWQVASPASVRAPAKRAIGAVQDTAEQLRASGDWPSEYLSDVEATADEFLAMATPLQQIVDADSSKAMFRAWERLVNMPRIAEQRLRTSMGLGLARTNKDGCPRVPKASAPTGSSSGQEGQVPTPATGGMPQLNGPMIEATGDALCTTYVYNMPDLVTPSSDASWTRVIQVMAVQYGFNPGVVDGQYGPNTVSAVQGLQAYLGVVPDGQVGPITWTALQNDYCGGPPP